MGKAFEDGVLSNCESRPRAEKGACHSRTSAGLPSSMRVGNSMEDAINHSISALYETSRSRESKPSIQPRITFTFSWLHRPLATLWLRAAGTHGTVSTVFARRIFLNFFFAPISSVKQVDMSPFFPYTCAVVQGLLCLVVKGKSSAPEHRTTERGCWKSGRNGAPAPQSRVKPLRCKQMQFTPRGEASLRST